MVPLRLLRHATETEAYEEGAVIFQQGDPGTSMYVVQEGEVEIQIDHSTLEVVSAGGIFGELVLIDEGPRSATAIAATDCKLISINRRQFDFLVRHVPRFGEHVMKIMSERLRRMDSFV